LTAYVDDNPDGLPIPESDDENAQIALKTIKAYNEEIRETDERIREIEEKIKEVDEKIGELKKEAGL